MPLALRPRKADFLVAFRIMRPRDARTRRKCEAANAFVRLDCTMHEKRIGLRYRTATLGSRLRRKARREGEGATKSRSRSIDE